MIRSPRVLGIVNPTAGRAGGGALRRAVATLEAAGWRIDLRTPASVEATRDLGAAPDADLVLVAGGDGTLAALLQAYPAGGPPVALLPFGSANVVARDLGLPLSPAAAAAALASGVERSIDVGEIRWPGGARRRFILSVGVGAIARAVHHAEGAWKRAIGRAAYGVAFVRTLTAHDRVVVEAGGEVLEGGTAVALLTRHYAGPFVPVPDSPPADGLIDLLVVQENGARLLAAACALALGRAEHTKGIRRLRVDRFTVRTDDPLEADGDPIPPSPIEVSVVGRVRMLGAPA